jgi:hypothetical protein
MFINKRPFKTNKMNKQEVISVKINSCSKQFLAFLSHFC